MKLSKTTIIAAALVSSMMSGWAACPSTGTLDELLQSASGHHWLALTLGGNLTITGPSLMWGMNLPYLGISKPGTVSLTGSSEIDLGGGTKPTAPPYHGLFFEDSQSHLTTSGTAFVNGPIFVGTDHLTGSGSFPFHDTFVDDMIMTARDDANTAASCAAGLPATKNVGSSIKGSITITGGPGMNVINLQDLVLNGNAVVTLVGDPSGSQFIFNVSRNFQINSTAKIALVNMGSQPELNVLYNVVGPGSQVAMTGGTAHGMPNSQISGILLATDRLVALDPGLVNGTVIAHAISITSGGEIISHFQ